MKKFLPYIVVGAILVGVYFVLFRGDISFEEEPLKLKYIPDITKEKMCGRLPYFLYKNNFKKPMIDLSQQKYKGVAFIDKNRVLYKKSWGRFDPLGSYTLSLNGDIYLTPMPHISIKPYTFNLQKMIFKLDSKSGELKSFLKIDEINPNNIDPYGIIAIVYDCDDNSLIVSSIDESNLRKMGGKIYKINIDNKKIKKLYSGFDAFSLALGRDRNQKILIAGSAYNEGVYLFTFKKDGSLNSPFRLFNLPDSTLRVRKVRILGKNRLYLEAIPFSYNLIAQASKEYREKFLATFEDGKWKVRKIGMSKR